MAKDKINAAYAFGGEELMIKTVSNFLNASINHYVTIDFDGFIKLIDELGGVDIVVDRPLIDPKSGASFSPGTITLQESRRWLTQEAGLQSLEILEEFKGNSIYSGNYSIKN